MGGLGASFQSTKASRPHLPGHPGRTDLPSRPRSPADALRSIHSRIGNQSTAAVLAKHRTDAPDHPREREADAFADSVLAAAPTGPSCACEASGTPCEHCAASTAGRPLDPATQSAIGKVGVDTTHVRVHTGAEAARTADDLDARAFTVGSDVSFAAGAYQPDTTAGLRLVAHEVAHTLQHAQTGEARINRTPSGAGSKVPDKQADAGPCGVDAAALSNDGLLLQLNRARIYLTDHEWGEDATYDWANLMRRLSAERRRRATGGDAWLAQRGLAATPPVLYSLEPSGVMGIAVRTADSGEAANRTAPTGALTLTPEQFDVFLARNGIPQVDAASYFGSRDPKANEALNLTLPARPRQELVPNDTGPALPFSPPNTLGTNTFDTPFPFGANASPFTAPGWHNTTVIPTAATTLRDVADSPSSVTSGGPERLFRPAGATRRGPQILISPYGFLTIGGPPSAGSGGVDLPTGGGVDFSTMTPTGPSFGDLFAPSAGKPLKFRSQAKAARGAFESGLLDPSSGQLGLHTHGVASTIRDEFGVTGKQLESAHVLPNDVLETLGLSGDSGLAALAPKEVNSAIDRQWKAAWKRAKANGEQLTVADVHDIVRRSFANAPDNVVNPQMKGTLQFALEYQIYSRMGLAPNDVVLSGTPRPAGPASTPVVEPGPSIGPDGRVVVPGEPAGGMRPGMKSGLAGASLMLLGDLWSSQHGANPNYLADAGIGYASGEAQTFLESAAQPYLTRTLASAGLSDAASGVGGKLAGSAGAAFVIAPITTGLQMYCSDEKYTTIDYEAKMSRSTVGALGGALAAGGYGALAGSEVPGPGNAVGFIVGFGGYLLTDWLVGDEVEDAVRNLAGEQGCTGGIGPGK